MTARAGTREGATRDRILPMELLLRVNGAERRFAPPLTVEGLVGKLGVEGKRIAIERNGEIVPRSRYAEVELADGDRLEVVVAVGGG